MPYFAIMLAFKIGLALLTLLTALRAARLWWEASAKMPRLVDFVAGSPDHVLQVETEAAEAAALNSKAALWGAGQPRSYRPSPRSLLQWRPWTGIDLSPAPNCRAEIGSPEVRERSVASDALDGVHRAYKRARWNSRFAK